MSVEIAAVWINPYTIEKSRTGGVIARLLSLTSSELVAARMFTPSRELVEKYCLLIPPKGSSESRKVREHIRVYIREHWIAKEGDRDHPRVLVLLFKGEGAISALRSQVVGPIARDSILGETVRDTYGDYIKDSQGRVRYFEPAVFIIPERPEAEKILRLWARYSDADGGILSDACHFPPDIKPEKTLVIMKPENFKGPSALAGNVMDVISRTGLRIIGAKIVHMSINQAEEFYQPVLRVLPDRIKPGLVEELKKCLNDAFSFNVPSALVESLADKLKCVKARNEFRQIIRTMTGLDPLPAGGVRRKKKPGGEKCLALIYKGANAIRKIRSVLGATDPLKARLATVRRIYGHSINENVAHASDSPKNFAREIKIIQMEKNDFKKVITDFYRK